MIPNFNSSGFDDGHVSSDADGADDHHLTEHHHKKIHLHRIVNSPHHVKDIIETAETAVIAYEEYLLDRIDHSELAKVMTTLYRLLPMSMHESKPKSILKSGFGMGKTFCFLIEQELKRKRA